MKISSGSWLLLLALVFSFCFPYSQDSATARQLDQLALVMISPATYSGEAGDSVHVSVWVEDVIDLFGADIQIQFTPGALEVVDANPSLPGVQVSVRSDFLQPDLLLHREADNLAGTIWYAAAQMYPSEPVTGSGILFEFDMKINQAGAFALIFSSTQLAGVGGVSIAHTSQGALFTTLGVSNIYLPVIIR